MARFTFVEDEPTAQQPQAPAQPQGRYSFVDPASAGAGSSFLRGLYQGGTFEWGDELQGLVTGDTEAARAQSRAAAEADPTMYRAGKLVGGFGSALVPGGMILRGVQAGRGLVGAARAGAMAGGGFGAVEGLGESEGGDPMRAAERTVKGAVTGAVAGGVGAPALYSLGAGARAGGRVLSDWAHGGNQTALRKTAQALERQGQEPSELANALMARATPGVTARPEVLTEALRGLNAGRTPTQVAAEVNRQFGTNLTPQQVGKLNAGFGRATGDAPRDLLRLSEEVGAGTAEANRSGLTNLMQAVATMPGRGREVALQNMGRTMEEAPGRLTRRLSDETGSGTNFRGALAQRQEQRRQNANRAYEAADRESTTAPMARALRGEQTNTVPELVQPILGRFIVRSNNLTGARKSHVDRAVDIITNRGTQRGVPQTVREYHSARQEIDRMLTDLRRSASPEDRDAARIIGELRRAMNAVVQRNYPAFRHADRQFADDISREEAMDLGRQYALRLGTKQDDIIAQMRGLERRNPTHAAELREYMMQGIMRNMADDIARAGGMPPRWTQPLTGGVRPEQREALEGVLAAPLPRAPVATRNNPARGEVKDQPVPHHEGRQMSGDILGVLNDEARLRKIFTDVWGNSKTAERLAAQQDMAELPRIAAEMATGGWLSGMRQAVANRLVAAVTERNNEQIARIVTETDPRVLYVALQDMQRMLPQMRAGERFLGAPSAATGSSIGQLLTGP